MTNIIAPTGFWIENNDNEHLFSPQLSEQINNYIEKHNINSIYDFGCGRGEYLHEAVKKYPEIKATGFEGHQTSGIFNNIIKMDLSSAVNLPSVDLVISIEVGEHIPVEFEKYFLDNITESSNRHIIMSWAIEGQSGLGHINCRNNDYIIKEIEKRGFIFNKTETDFFRSKIVKGFWLKNTLMIFQKPI